MPAAAARTPQGPGRETAIGPRARAPCSCDRTSPECHSAGSRRRRRSAGAGHQDEPEAHAAVAQLRKRRFGCLFRCGVAQERSGLVRQPGAVPGEVRDRGAEGRRPAGSAAPCKFATPSSRSSAGAMSVARAHRSGIGRRDARASREPASPGRSGSRRRARRRHRRSRRPCSSRDLARQRPDRQRRRIGQRIVGVIHESQKVAHARSVQPHLDQRHAEMSGCRVRPAATRCSSASANVRQ